MEYLKELIAKKTPILEIKNDCAIPNEIKEKVLDVSADEERKKEYQKMMVYHNQNWYYFKKEQKYNAYPFYLIDELIGSYLCKELKKKTVTFFLARYKKDLGLVSKNFKTEENEYISSDFILEKYYQEKESVFIPQVKNFSYLKTLNEKESDKEMLIHHILEMMAIDLYMIQTDRKGANIQFQKNKETGVIDLAPLYDFSNCLDEWKVGDFIKSDFLWLGDLSLPKLAKQYPYFKEYLLNLLEYKMSDLWKKISIDYDFNQETIAYEEILKHYQKKEKKQYKRIRELIK